MPAWQRVYASTVLVNALPGTAAETIVAQVQVSTVSADQVVILDAWAKITTGASTTSIAPRFRRATVAGTVVGDQNLITIVGAVGSTGEYGHRATDTPGEVASLLYVFTIVQNAVTVAGTALGVFIRAIV